jgi:hypothetical protein
MSNVTKTIIWVAVLAVLIAVSALLYNKLAGDAEPTPSAADTSAPTDTAEPGETDETERIAARNLRSLTETELRVAFSSYRGSRS